MQPTIFFFIFVGVQSTVNSKLSVGCDRYGILLYQDIGCTPQFIDGRRCPLYYNCDSFASNNETCLFRGRRYNVSQEVEDNLITENCFVDCKCVDPAGFEKYQCKIMNCTEWSDAYNATRCYRTYDVDKCCSIGKKCPKGLETIPECEFKGVIYKKGQLFIPPNTCSKCSCQEGFKGKIEEPFCKRTLCAAQIMNYEELENYCAPLYLLPPGQTAQCCPVDWVCHTGNDTIVKINPKRRQREISCKFGPEMLRIGEGFTRLFDYFGMDLNITCECAVPPLLRCIKTDIETD